MAATALQKQFKNVFEENGIEVEDADTLQEVILLAFKKGATAAQMADSYEAYCLNTGMDSSTMAKSHLEAFERHMMEQKPSIKAEPVSAPMEKIGGTAAARLGFFKPDPSTPSPTSSLYRFPSPGMGMGASPDVGMEPLSLEEVSPGEKGAPSLAPRAGVVSLNSRRSTAPSPFQQRVNRLRVVSSYVGAKTPRGVSQGKPAVPSQAPSTQTQQSVKAEPHSPPRPAPAAAKAVPVKEEPVDAEMAGGKDPGDAERNNTATGTTADSGESKDVEMREETAAEKSPGDQTAGAQGQVEPAASVEGSLSEEVCAKSASEKRVDAPVEGASAEVATAKADYAEGRDGSSGSAPAEGEAERGAVKSEPVHDVTAAQEGATPVQEGGGEAQKGVSEQEMETGAGGGGTGPTEAVRAGPPDGAGAPGDSQGEDKADEMACVPAEPAEPVSRERCAVQPLEVAKLREGSRCMADSAETRWRELNNRFERFIRALQAADPSFDVSQLNLHASQGRKSAVGRICCDSEDSSGSCHLNPSSILLEGCLRPGCEGSRVKLDVSDIPEFSLFPGQVVFVEGENPSGRYFKASRLRTLVPPPFPASDPSSEAQPAEKRARKVHPSTNKWKPSQTQPLTMVVAAGPYTANDNWAYEPLEALLEYVQGVGPDILLLLGPFVDSEHPDAQRGVVEELFEDIFRGQVLRMIQRAQQLSPRFSRTRVVVQPALRDAMHQNVFPQPPLGRDLVADVEASGGVSLCNPSLFTCDEQVTVACTTMDVLRHLSSEEAARAVRGRSIDRMSRLALHLLGQRSFYPLFPPAPGACLDTSLAPQALQIPLMPHLLFLPSDLAAFAKALPLDDACAREEVRVQEVAKAESESQEQQQGQERQGSGRFPFRPLCINPGRLTKGPSGGTFCQVSVYSSESESFHEHVQVDILRI